MIQCLDAKKPIQWRPFARTLRGIGGQVLCKCLHAAITTMRRSHNLYCNHGALTLDPSRILPLRDRSMVSLRHICQRLRTHNRARS